MPTIGSYISSVTPDALPGSSFVYIRIGEKYFWTARDAFKGIQPWGGYYELVNGNGNPQEIIDALPDGQAGDLPLMFEISRTKGASPMAIMHNAYVTISQYLLKDPASKWKNRLVLISTADTFLRMNEDINNMTGDSAPQYKTEWAYLKGLDRCEKESQRTGWKGLVMTFDYLTGFEFNGIYESFLSWASKDTHPDSNPLPTPDPIPNPTGQPTDAEIANAIRVLARVFMG